MQRMIFVNLPVTDLERSVAFYKALGFTQNTMFSNEHVAYLAIEDNIALMIGTAQHLGQFVREGHSLTLPEQGVAHLIALSAENRDEVEALTAAAHAAGAGEWLPPQDYGHMYGTSFTDPDGHVLEVIWMDLAVATEQLQQAAVAVS